MTEGSRRLQASLSLTIEFVTTPTKYLRKPVSDIMFHLSWPFLDPLSTTLLCVAAPVMSCYRKLRTEVSSITAVEIHRICTPLDHRKSTSYICSLWEHDVDNKMLQYNFRPGGMIRCPGGVYTSDFLNFALINACLLALSNITVNPWEPP